MKQASIPKLSLMALAFAPSAQYALAARANLPPVQHRGNVTFMTGGIGLNESTAVKDVMHEYPLAREFAGETHNGNDYLADIPVTVSYMRGDTVLKTTAKGPFLLASLSDGRYSVAARFNGKVEHRDVDITPSGSIHELFLWPM